MSSTYCPFSPPEDSWLASALNCTPSPTRHHHSDTGSLLSLPHAYIFSPTSRLSHVFRFNGCWSSFRLLLLLSVVFLVFSSVTHGHGSLAQDILQSLTLIPDAHTSNSASGGTPSVESTTVVISQSLSRTALNVSLLRYIAFVFRLLVCLVPSQGVMNMYQKASRAKVEEDIFLLISYIPPP